MELAYVMDQRNREGGKGQFQMTDLDKKVTSKMQESQDRKAKDKKSSKPISSNNNHKDDQNNTDDMPPPSEVADIGDIQPVREGEQVQESFDDNDPEDSDFTPDFLLDKKEKNPSNRNMMSLKNVVRECMRWGVSPKAGASIANAALIDAGVVTKDNQTKIIDKNKLKRQMEKYQVDIREKEMEELQKAPPEGIYFDGKKDDTLTLEKDERGVWKVVQ